MGKTKKHGEFYEQDTQHGFVKRMMYKKYLQAYIEKTQNERFNLKTIIIDGFAGPGRYSKYEVWPKEIAKYGSPLIALRVTLNTLLKKAKRFAVNHSEDEFKELAKSKEGFDENTAITMIFIEADEKYYTSLVDNIKGMLKKFLPTYSDRENSEKDKHSTTFSINIRPYSFAIKVHNKKFEKFDPPKELAAECTRSLTFLDPFGFKNTPMNHVKKFAPGGGNEILINFMSQAVDRNIKNKESIRALYGIEDGELDEFVNYISDSKNEEDLNRSSRNCTERYAHYLKSKTQTAYARSFEARNEKDDIIYHLIHITNHIRGVEAMKESMNRCSQKRGEMAMSEYDFFQKDDKLNFKNLDKNPNVVADMIFEKFKGEQDVLLEPSTPLLGNTIKEFVLLDTKFLYRKTAIATLQRKGKITKVVDETNMPQKRKNTFPDKDSKTKRPKKWRVSFAQQ